MTPTADMDGCLSSSALQVQPNRPRTGRRAASTTTDGGKRAAGSSTSSANAGPASRVAEPARKETLKMQTFALGDNGVFGQANSTTTDGGLRKGERISPCGQFIIDADGNWKPNTANPPSRAGARDPSDPIKSTRQAVKFGRRATPVSGKKVAHRLPRDPSYDSSLG